MKESLEVRNDLPKLFQDTARRKAKFWKLFQHQYLESIKFTNDKMKKTGGGLIPKAGDVVIMHSHDPRLRWRKAIVIKPIISDDGECRRCIIKTSTGIRERATNHLHPLELTAETFRDQCANNPLQEEDFLGFEEGGMRVNRALQLRNSIARLTTEQN